MEKIAHQKWKTALVAYQRPDFPAALDKDLKKYMASLQR